MSCLPSTPLAPLMIWTDTNNLLTLFTKLYSDAEVLRKVVVVKADRYSWYVQPHPLACIVLCRADVSQGPVPPGRAPQCGLCDPLAWAWTTGQVVGEQWPNLAEAICIY